MNTAARKAVFWPWLLLAAAIVVADQISKRFILNWLPYNDGFPVASVLNIVHVVNTGAAFSFLAGAGGWQRWAFTLLGLGVSAFIVTLLWRGAQPRLFACALSFIMGGALGNVIDRIAYGHVVDFIQVHWRDQWYFPSFNLADSAITVGAVLLVLDELLRMRRSK